jgi:hypothetical protein
MKKKMPMPFPKGKKGATESPAVEKAEHKGKMPMKGGKMPAKGKKGC